jgi:hypothetical protein
VRGIILASGTCCHNGGQAIKAPFQKGSAVTAAQLSSTTGQPIGRAIGRVLDDQGHYSIGLPWSGPTLVTITGRYFDEFTGQLSSDPVAAETVS